MLRTVPGVLSGIVVSAAEQSGVSGKLSLPVRPSSEIQAHLRHVVGVGSADGQGVPLIKLQMLDSLIESYLKIQRSPPELGGGGLGVRVDARSVDTTIAAVSADLHEALAAGVDPAGGRVAEPGAALSLGV